MPYTARTAKQLGEAVSRLRRKKAITQTYLGRKAGLRQGTISSLENGESGTWLKTLFKVMAALDLEIVIRPRSKGSSKDIEDIF